MEKKTTEQALREINRERTTVHGKRIGVGFFIYEAVCTVGDAKKTYNAIRKLNESGILRTSIVDVAGMNCEFYSFVK